MVVKRKFFEREEKRALKEVKAVVVHWPGGSVVPEITALWKWMNSASNNSYHFLISQKNIIQTRDLKLRAIHCGHSTYTNKAKAFFGERTCSNLDSPNNYTIGVCLLHDKIDGSYSTATIDSAIDVLAILCLDNNLDPMTDLLRHSDLTNEKEIPCPKYFFEDDDDPDDLWCTFKEWVRDRVAYYEIEIGCEG